MNIVNRVRDLCKPKPDPLTKETRLSSFKGGWSGVPSIVDLGGTRVGSLIPEVNEDVVSVILTVHDWQTTDLQEIARITLRKFESRPVNWQCMAPHYDAKNDTMLVWEGDIRSTMSEEFAGVLHKFPLKKAIDQSRKSPDNVPTCIAQITTPTSILGVNAIHKDE